ncbi:MAG: phage tail protein [Firmicutes bacterium]|jgi:phage tail-like protein|nr:phage tail protein [Bacillota bacterium]
MSDQTKDTVVGIYFSLEIDGTDLGIFDTCSGLGIEIETEQRQEGGVGIFVHQLPGRFKYTNLQVTRPIGSNTAKTMAWLNKMSAPGIKPTSARLSALAPDGSIVFAWSLVGVIPVRWTGPTFSSSDPQPATETLEMAYSAIMLDPSDTKDDIFKSLA